jgi:Fe/S biogenesis protein NfuA
MRGEPAPARGLSDRARARPRLPRLVGEPRGRWFVGTRHRVSQRRIQLHAVARSGQPYGSGDLVQNEGDLPIVVAADSIEKLRGATIDWREDPPRSGFIVVNPNKPPRPLALPVLPMSLPADPGGAPGRRTPQAAPPAPPGNLDSDLARQVIAVLERDVNPSIAAHGGHAELVAVEGSTAYLRLGGGCQGCGMATVTLSQGIEVAITEAVPQIAAIVDVTDHASGRNPYFEPAKK